MKLRWDQLQRHVAEPLRPVYVVHGDEILLLQEAGDTLPRAARSQGYSERELHHADRGADWGELLASANTLSLFGDRKLLEIRFSGKPDAAAAAALEGAEPPPDAWCWSLPRDSQGVWAPSRDGGLQGLDLRSVGAGRRC